MRGHVYNERHTTYFSRQIIGAFQGHNPKARETGEFLVRGCPCITHILRAIKVTSSSTMLQIEQKANLNEAIGPRHHVVNIMDKQLY
jgi:hypothetical protein